MYAITENSGENSNNQKIHNRMKKQRYKRGSFVHESSSEDQENNDRRANLPQISIDGVHDNESQKNSESIEYRRSTHSGQSSKRSREQRAPERKNNLDYSAQLELTKQISDNLDKILSEYDQVSSNRSRSTDREK